VPYSLCQGSLRLSTCQCDLTVMPYATYFIDCITTHLFRGRKLGVLLTKRLILDSAGLGFQGGQTASCSKGSAQWAPLLKPPLPGACRGYTGCSLVIHGCLLWQQSFLGLSQIQDYGIHMAVRVTHPMPGGNVAIETKIPYGAMINAGSVAAGVQH
jgi:hypothetical protein